MQPGPQINVLSTEELQIILVTHPIIYLCERRLTFAIASTLTAANELNVTMDNKG
jgi:hypothetical protein